jgi:hypothetical protein
MKTKIGDVTRLLESIADGLAGINKDAANGLRDLHLRMRPFHEQSIEQFTEFLQACDEYKRTGVVSSKAANGKTKSTSTGISASDAATMIRALLAEIDRGTVTSMRIDTLLNGLKKDLAKPQKSQWEQLLVELNIHSKPKTIDGAKELVRQMLNSQLEMYVKRQAYNATA